MSSNEVKEVKVDELAVALGEVALVEAVVVATLEEKPAVEAVVVAALEEKPMPVAGNAMGGAGGVGNSSSSAGGASSAPPPKGIDMSKVIAMCYFTKGGDQPCTVYCAEGTSEAPCGMVNITYIVYITLEGFIVKWTCMLACERAKDANAAWTSAKKALVEGKPEADHRVLLAGFPAKPHPAPAPRVTGIGAVPHVEIGGSSKWSFRIVGSPFGAPDSCSPDFVGLLRKTDAAIDSGVPALEAMAPILAIIEANREGDRRLLEVIGASERMKTEYGKAAALVLAKDAKAKATKAASSCNPYPSGCLTCECPRCYDFDLTRGKVIAKIAESLKKDAEFVAFRSAFDKANAAAPLLGF